MSKEDSLFIKKAQENTKEFEALYKKYASKVFNYFWYRTGHDRDLSEDLLQETFLRAFKKLSSFKDKGYSYLTYLLTIAHNVLIDHYRKPESAPIEEAETVPYEITQDIEKKIEAENLWRAIQTLPADDRDVLLMKYQSEMPIRDIAEVMNKSENAVKLQLSRTRKKLSTHPYLQDVTHFADTKKTYTKPRFLD